MESVCCWCCHVEVSETSCSLNQKSPTEWCVVVCDLETSWMRRPWPTGGCGAKRKNERRTVITQAVLPIASRLLDPNIFHNSLNLIDRCERKGKDYPATCPCRQKGAVRILNVEARWWWVVSATPRSLDPGERDTLPIVQESGWASVDRAGVENLSCNGFRIPDRSARSESLYRLHYCGCPDASSFMLIWSCNEAGENTCDAAFCVTIGLLAGIAYQSWCKSHARNLSQRPRQCGWTLMFILSRTFPAISGEAWHFFFYRCFWKVGCDTGPGRWELMWCWVKRGAGLITAFLPDHFKSSEEAAACADSAVMRSPFVLIQATYQQQIIWTTRGHPKNIWRQNVINCQIWQTGCQCSYITRKQAGREMSGTRKRN